MGSRLVKHLSRLVLLGFVTLALGQIGAAQDGRLVGTWRVTVTQVDCQTAAALAPPFSSLLTFAVGGTLAEDTTNPIFGPGQRGAGQGVWNPLNRFTFRAKSLAFINYTTVPNPAAHNPGFQAGEQTILQTITFNPKSDQWTSEAAIAFTDTTGAVYRQGCAAAIAQRF
jgi:hypothetical protein